MNSDASHRHYETLLNEAVDGTIGVEEAREFEAHLAACAACRAEFDDFRSIKKVTDAMTQRILEDAHLEPLRPQGIRRAVLFAAFGMVFLGLAMMSAQGLYDVIRADDMPPLMHIGLITLLSGTALLAIYVLYSRVRTRGRDPYREIDL